MHAQGVEEGRKDHAAAGGVRMVLSATLVLCSHPCQREPGGDQQAFADPAHRIKMRQLLRFV